MAFPFAMAAMAAVVSSQSKQFGAAGSQVAFELDIIIYMIHTIIFAIIYIYNYIYIYTYV